MVFIYVRDESLWYVATLMQCNSKLKENEEDPKLISYQAC